ncbi:MAG: hypothetical protein HRT57_05710 [Crocinitomicaceae bacterium]|nr:hypothetical protein [Crocinitomicaceae bacterium]
MKNRITPILIIVLFIVSCGESTEPTNTAEENTEQTDNTDTGVEFDDSTNIEGPNMEGTPVEGDERYDNMSLESTSSDCFIVSHFIDMDISYITVDFTNYKVIETNSEPEYELVNEIKTLRTFVVKTEYFDCGRGDMVPIDILIDESEQDKETLFYIETEGGLVVELFVRNCAG